MRRRQEEGAKQMGDEGSCRQMIERLQLQWLICRWKGGRGGGTYSVVVLIVRKEGKKRREGSTF